jgi:hypothetical protein
MFFIFLVSVSVLTVIVTGSCLRVISECYLEGVREEEEEERQYWEQHQQQQQQHGSGNNHYGYYKDDDEWMWTNGTNTSQQQPQQHPLLHRFHYHIALRILSKLPIELVFGLFSLLCAWSITSLTCFHALIITLGQTTNERVRGVYQYGGVINPDDNGCWNNWMEMMCKKIPESRLPTDFSDVVDLNDVSTGSSNRLGGGAGGGEEEEAAAAAPIVLEESVWSGWQESRMIPPPHNIKNKR